MVIMPEADINGTRMYYRSEGRGIPLIFIHPPVLDSTNFTYQLEQLSDTYRIITFDMRGHGRSAYSPRKLTYALIADDICALMDELGLRKAYIAGYSTGGTIALEALLTYPDRFYGGILLSGLSEASTFVLTGEIRAAIRLSRLRAQRLLTSAVCAANADSLQTFKRLYSTAIQGDIRNQHQYYRESLIYNCTRRLNEIQAPVLLLYGKQDKALFPYARMLREHLPKATMQFIPGVRHHLPTKAPGKMHEAMRLWVSLVHPKDTQPENEDAKLPDLPVDESVSSEAERSPQVLH
ncbi:hydrolase [Paenibacillus mucilaginosus K02]|uniref:Hydrolase n=2 Tax=Paenibacillus mucilaginosus TaxID=61624 RepID=I0BLD5_9BACL|nr:hydrolase [Paenibacillus mucilaginosus K02]